MVAVQSHLVQWFLAARLIMRMGRRPQMEWPWIPFREPYVVAILYVILIALSPKTKSKWNSTVLVNFDTSTRCAQNGVSRRRRLPLP